MFWWSDISAQDKSAPTEVRCQKSAGQTGVVTKARKTKERKANERKTFGYALRLLGP